LSELAAVAWNCVIVVVTGNDAALAGFSTNRDGKILDPL